MKRSKTPWFNEILCERMDSNIRQSRPWIQPLLGALASVALLNYVGRQNQSMVLRILFSLWVFGPFLTYLIATRFLKRQRELHGTMSIITAVSVSAYILTAMFMRVKPAGPFVAIPPIAVVVLAITGVRANSK